LVVHSYHTGYGWVDDIDEGLKTSLGDTGVTMETMYMDTKRKSDEASKKAAADAANKKIAEFKPDVVITSDDNAQALFAKDYAGKDSPAIVFCGVNAEPDKYGFPASNVTGVLERPHAVETVDLLQKINPEIKKVAFILDDSTTGQLVNEYIKTQKLSAEAVFENVGTFADWQAAVKKHAANVDAFVMGVYHTINDGDSRKEPKEIMEWTIANAGKTVGAMWGFGIADGAIAGVVVSGKENGLQSGKFAAEILGGKKAGDIPMIPAKKGEVMFNVASAGKLGIEIPFELIETADNVIE
jgi:ABC-type uncharacterized transport system substrate-binding protein